MPETFRCRRGRWVAAVLVVLAGVPALPAAATHTSAYDLDPSFGDGGVTASPDDPRETVFALVVQPDDRAVAAGTAYGDFALFRHDFPTMQLDPTFNGGRVLTDLGGDDAAYGLARLGDGRLLAVGVSDTTAAMVRYTGVGGLDAGFGDHGVVRPAFPEPAALEAVLLQPDGAAVAVGTAHGNVALARVTAAGTPDAGFGVSGVVTTDLGADEVAHAVARQPDGALVVAGDTGDDIFIARYTATGTLDPGFGTGGVVVLDRGGVDTAFALVLQSSGRIVVAGNADESVAVTRFTAAGAVDGSFGTSGTTTHAMRGSDTAAYAMVQLGDGRLFVAGESAGDFAQLGLTVDGAVDPSIKDDNPRFSSVTGHAGAAYAAAVGSDGSLAIAGRADGYYRDEDMAVRRFNTEGGILLWPAYVDFAGMEDGGDIARRDDGRLVVGGSRGSDFAASRFLPDGSLDTSFGDDGTAVVDRAGTADKAEAVALHPDGGVVLVGWSGCSGAVLRLDAAGHVVRSFGPDDDGWVVLPGSESVCGGLHDVVVQPDGRVIVAGDGALWRFLADGSADPTFAGGGMTTSAGAWGRVALALDATGRIYRTSTTTSQLARHHPDGVLDTTFGSNGYAAAPATFDSTYLTSLVLQQDGKPVVAGWIRGRYGYDWFRLVRFTTGGVPDPSFGDGGEVRTDFDDMTGGSGARALSLAVQPDGKLVAAGYIGVWGLARYQPDGTPDPTFGDGDERLSVYFSEHTDGVRGLALDEAGRLLASGRLSVPGGNAMVAARLDAFPVEDPPPDEPDPSFEPDEPFESEDLPPSPPPPSRSGYWMASSAGAVYAFGDARALGNAPAAEDIEASPSGNGYWIVDGAGHVFTFGDAPYLGGWSRGPLAPGERVTSISRTSGRGYWLFTSRGRVQLFGDARWYGDLAGVALNGPVLDSIPSPEGGGYYMVASDGGIFAFGNAGFRGSMGGHRLNAPVQSLVPDPDGVGYWLVASDGGVFAFDAPFRGSMGSVRLNRPVTGMVPFGNGYLMVGEDGGIFNFSDRAFHGSLGANPPPSPIVSVAALT